LQGRHGVWCAGIHLGHGFHEGGPVSTLAVARGLGAVISWKGQHSPAPMRRSKNGRYRIFPATRPVAAELF
jgi:predicted NAD/FAD-binding protein